MDTFVRVKKTARATHHKRKQPEVHGVTVSLLTLLQYCSSSLGSNSNGLRPARVPGELFLEPVYGSSIPSRSQRKVPPLVMSWIAWMPIPPRGSKTPRLCQVTTNASSNLSDSSKIITGFHCLKDVVSSSCTLSCLHLKASDPLCTHSNSRQQVLLLL